MAAARASPGGAALLPVPRQRRKRRGTGGRQSPARRPARPLPAGAPWLPARAPHGQAAGRRHRWRPAHKPGAPWAVRASAPAPWCARGGPRPPARHAGPGQSPRCCRLRWRQRPGCRPAPAGCCWQCAGGCGVPATTAIARYPRTAGCSPPWRPTATPRPRRPRRCAAAAPSRARAARPWRPARPASGRCSGPPSPGPGWW